MNWGYYHVNGVDNYSDATNKGDDYKVWEIVMKMMTLLVIWAIMRMSHTEDECNGPVMLMILLVTMTITINDNYDNKNRNNDDSTVKVMRITNVDDGGWYGWLKMELMIEDDADDWGW